MFALKGSKYEAIHDVNGDRLNEDEISYILENKNTDAYNVAMEVDK
jgi:hypothetical protein